MCFNERWSRWYKNFWKIMILKGVCPSLKFQDVQCDFSALESAHRLKFCLKPLFLIINTMSWKFLEFSKIMVNFGIRNKSHHSCQTTFPRVLPTPGDPITTAGNDGTSQSSHNWSTRSSFTTISQSAFTDSVEAVTGSKIALRYPRSRISPWHDLLNLITNIKVDPLQNSLWFLIFNNAEFQHGKTTRILRLGQKLTSEGSL